MKKQFLFSFSILTLVLALIAGTGTGCGVYSLSDRGTIPDSIKTVRVAFIENRAPYVNPRLSPTLTESVRQKIIRQTRLVNTNNDNAHYNINATITDYSVTTSGVSTQAGRQQGSINNLNVSVHITLVNSLSGKTEEYDVSRQFPYSAQLTLQAAEGRLFDEIVRNITDEIFNRIFSNW